LPEIENTKKMHLIFIGYQEIILILLIVLLIFGGRKIPELMKGLGKGVRSFKKGLDGTDDAEDKKEEDIKKE